MNIFTFKVFGYFGYVTFPTKNIKNVPKSTKTSKKPTNHKSQTKECQFKQKSKQKNDFLLQKRNIYSKFIAKV